MDPTGPSQPTLDQAYETAGNPVDQSLQEASLAARNAQSNSGSIVDRREKGDIPVPSTHGQEATPSSLGYGVRDASGDAGESVSLRNCAMNLVELRFHVSQTNQWLISICSWEEQHQI